MLARVTVLVGLTGGIGSGKSTVARLFEKLGAVVIDADAIVHELQAPGSPVLAEIADAFGPGVLDASGALDREALAAIVFRDPEARERLGAIVHPKVGVEFARRIALARQARVPLVVCDIPLLFEGRRAGRGTASVVPFDATVVVWAPEELQIERQIAREGYDRDEALRRVRAQMPLDDKRALADHVVENAGSLEDLERRVREVHAALTGADAGAP